MFAQVHKTGKGVPSFVLVLNGFLSPLLLSRNCFFSYTRNVGLQETYPFYRTFLLTLCQISWKVRILCFNNLPFPPSYAIIYTLVSADTIICGYAYVQREKSLLLLLFEALPSAVDLS
jgi:hypothetical protein